MTNSRYMMLLGAIGTTYGIYCLIRLIASRTWASVVGRVLTSHKADRDTDAGKLEDAKIRYEYEVNGKTYSSSIIKAGGDISSPPSKKNETDVDKLLKKYPAGSPVLVYYNSRLPRMACLERDGWEFAIACLIVGLLALIIGYFFMK